MEYRVEGGTAEFGTDLVLILSDEQAAARASSIEKVVGKKDAWRPKRVVQFKAGETLGVECAPSALPGKLGMLLAPVSGDADKPAPTVAKSPDRRKRAPARKASAKK